MKRETFDKWMVRFSWCFLLVSVTARSLNALAAILGYNRPTSTIVSIAGFLTAFILFATLLNKRRERSKTK